MGETRPSLEDLRRAVAALEAHLVRSRGTVGSVVEVDEEVGVDLHPALGRAVDAQQPRAQPGIELVVPGRVERVGDVEPAPVQGQLDHLRPAAQLAAGVARLAEQPAEPEPAGQPAGGRDPRCRTGAGRRAASSRSRGSGRPSRRPGR